MTETERFFTADVINMATDLGLLVHHCPDSRRCEGQKGFPDLVIAGPRGLLLAELKTADGETSADQDRWHWMLAEPDRHLIENRNPWRLWRPADLESGTIRKELEAIS